LNQIVSVDISYVVVSVPHRWCHTNKDSGEDDWSHTALDASRGSVWVCECLDISSILGYISFNRIYLI
jgi:hypothetical protein